jgi:phage shock protein A
LTGLGLSALRVDLMQARYAAAQALEREKTLREEVRRLRGRVRELRDPAGLTRRAAEAGFARPERSIDLRPRLLARRVEFGNGGGR